MTKEDLEKELARPMGKKSVLKFAAIWAKNPDGITTLIDSTFHKDQTCAFRAAWILENVFELDIELLKQHVFYFLDRYPYQQNLSCRRHFSKILMLALSQKSIKNSLKDYNWEPVVEATFEWLTSKDGPVAVQVNCLDILYHLRHIDTWIVEELEAQIVFLLKDGSAAMQSRGKRVLKKINAKSRI